MATRRTTKRASRRSRDDVSEAPARRSDTASAAPTVVEAPTEQSKAGGDEVAATTRASSARDPGASESATTVDPTRERTPEPGPDDVAIPAQRSG